MTRAEFIQRAALTYGSEAIKAMEHIKALADAVDEVAPFDDTRRKTPPKEPKAFRPRPSSGIDGGF